MMTPILDQIISPIQFDRLLDKSVVETQLQIALERVAILEADCADGCSYAKDRVAQLTYQQAIRDQRISELETFIKGIHDNYDCDGDCHKYQNGFGCRCCEAKALLEGDKK